MRTISYGGGVQSTAMVVLAATGRIDADVALFCNVGDDSEHPDTITYVRDIATPWAADHGFKIIELSKTGRTLLAHITEHDDPTKLREPIPIRGQNGAPLSRSCTADWKIKTLGRWIKTNVPKAEWPVDTLIGISVDEIERAGRGRDEKHEHRCYPLLDLGMSRSHCEQVIRDVGLPVPPKSACWFCPFHRPLTWAEMRRDEPDLFAKSQVLEDLLNDRRDLLGKDHVYLTRFNRRLSDAIPMAQDALFDINNYASDIGEDGCDEGVCFV